MINTTITIYRSQYIFGKKIHNILSKIISEDCLYQYGLIKEDELELDIEGEFYPGDPGNPSYDPDKYDPPSSDEVFISSIMLNGKPFILTDEEHLQAEEAIMDVGRFNYDESFNEPDYNDRYEYEDRDCEYWNRIS
jgi:hypothetical protein